MKRPARLLLRTVASLVFIACATALAYGSREASCATGATTKAATPFGCSMAGWAMTVRHQDNGFDETRLQGILKRQQRLTQFLLSNLQLPHQFALL